MCNLEKRREYEKEKFQSDAKYIIDRHIRTFLKDIIRKNIKSSKYEILLGFTIQEFKQHIEGLFEPWMNWENYGEWEIDHIIPKNCIYYDNMKHPGIKISWSLQNLRPLEKNNNNRRKRKIA